MDQLGPSPGAATRRMATPGLQPSAQGLPGGTAGPGIVSTDPATRPGGLDSPAAPPPPGDQAFVQDLLSRTPYGPGGLDSIAGQLEGRGIKLQRHSDGRARGRIFMPDGRAVDLPGAGEGNDWWSNPTASGWGLTDRGFGGGGGGSAAPAAPMPGQTVGGAGLSQYLTGDPTEKIRAELDAIINGGNSPMAREALMRFMSGPQR